MAIQKFLVLCLFVVVAKAQSNSTTHIEDYIAANKREYASNIEDYDDKLQAFKELFLGRISTIDSQRDMAVIGLRQADDRLYTLSLLNDTSRDCVNKQKTTMPTMDDTTAILELCAGASRDQLDTIINIPQQSRTQLKSYYDETFDVNLKKCNNTTANYIACVVEAVTSADNYTIFNQKTFTNQMDSAKCLANTAVQQALECSYEALKFTLTSISTVDILTDKCIEDSISGGSSTSSGHLCENISYVPYFMVDYKNLTIPNPFYSNNVTVSCLMLDV